MSTPDSTNKRCSRNEKCVHPESTDGWLPATTDYFSPHKQRGNLREICKVCQSKKSLRWHTDNPDKARVRKHHWYSENTDKACEDSRRWYSENRDAACETARRKRAEHPQKQSQADHRYYIKNTAKVIAAKLQWQRDNPEKKRAIDRNRAARLRAAEGTHTAADIQRQYQVQKGLCYYCQCELNGTYHVDHVVPISRGGRNSPDNLVCACSVCNHSKGDKLLTEWDGNGGRLI